MTIRIPRGLAGRPRVALAPSRILLAACTTRYGESPGDEEIADLVEARIGTRPGTLAWFPVAHRDQPEGTVWKVLLCPACDPRSGRNLPSGAEPDPTPGSPSEVVLPEALWACRILEGGVAPRRLARGPRGAWVSRWSEGMLEFLDGPLREGSPGLGAWLEEEAVEEVAWRAPTEEDLADLHEEHPQAQMLSEPVASQRQERLADRTMLRRTAALVACGLLVALLVRVPVLWASATLRSTQERLAEVRPELDRLERLRSQALLDARYLEASAPAFRPPASVRPLLTGIAGRLPPGVRLGGLQFDFPPGEPAWRLRAEARLDDWRSVGVLVDSLRSVEGVSDVRVETQQREREKVQLVVALDGKWP